LDRRRLAVAAGALLLACVAVYARSFGGPFVFDDLESIPENPNIRQLWPITVPMSPPPALGALGGRPLVSLSFAVNHALGGLDVRGYHAVNLALHVLATLLVWRIAARSLASPALDGRLGGEGAAFAIALLWCVHPLLSEPVVYLVQRTELMMGGFYLLTLYASLRAWTDARVRRWQGVAIAACALGMACKEPMVTAPIVVALHDLAFRARPPRDLLRERGRFYAGLAAGWLVLGTILLGGAQVRGALGGLGVPMSSFDYLRMQARAITHYLRLALWPSPLTIAYDWTVPSVSAALPYGLVVVALLAASVWAVRVGRPWLGWLGAWFFLILAPTSSILPLRTEPVAERRMYLPLLAVIALLVLGVRALIARYGLQRTLGPALAGAGAIALGIATAARVTDYRSVLAVWEDALAKAPESTTVRNNLGNAYAFAGQMDRALAQYRESIRINPDHPLAYYNIGFTFVHQKRFAEAVEPLRQAVRIRPNDADSQYILARALAGSGRPAEALAHFETALDLKPDDHEARRDYAGALMAVGRTPDAARQLAEVLKREPRDAAAHSRLGNAYAGMGQQEAAIASYRTSLEINPTDARTRNNLATALVRTGRAAEAVVELKRALADDPRYALAHYNLANVLTRDGHAAEGARGYLETIRYSGEDARLRQMAFDHLRELRANRDAAPVIAAARQDPDAAVRSAATAALGA
jgi:tetratricopeptide (TPR) repeat protein